MINMSACFAAMVAGMFFGCVSILGEDEEDD